MTTAPPSSVSIAGICEQKNRRALLNVPPPRFTPVSPYPQFTQFALNMRRKAEILQYNANTTNSQTNKETKAQRFSHVMTGRARQQYTQEQLLDISNGDFAQCGIVYTPTSSSDVPGPVIDLYLDPAIPLYNYASPDNTRSYGIINSVAPELWSTYTTNDLAFPNATIAELFTLYIHNDITQNFYTYQFQTPIAITVSGGFLQFLPNHPITATIDNVYVYVYYNSTLVVSNDPNVNPEIKAVPIIMSDFVPLTLQVNDVAIGFGATFFAGLLTVENLYLFTQPGFIYDVKLAFGISITDNQFSNVELGAVANVSTYNTNNYNCTILSQPSTDTNTGFIFSS